jgi:type II secretion system protein I
MKRAAHGGFILLEVLFAAAVVTIAMASLISCLGRCIAAARAVQNYTIAQTCLANESYIFRVELLSDMNDQEGEFKDYPGFTWARKIEPTDTEDLYLQTITVFWRERGQPASDAVVEYRYLPEKNQQP